MKYYYNNNVGYLYCICILAFLLFHNGVIFGADEKRFFLLPSAVMIPSYQRVRLNMLVSSASPITSFYSTDRESTSVILPKLPGSQYQLAYIEFYANCTSGLSNDDVYYSHTIGTTSTSAFSVLCTGYNFPSIKPTIATNYLDTTYSTYLPLSFIAFSLNPVYQCFGGSDIRHPTSQCDLYPLYIPVKPLDNLIVFHQKTTPNNNYIESQPQATIQMTLYSATNNSLPIPASGTYKIDIATISRGSSSGSTVLNAPYLVVENNTIIKESDPVGSIVIQAVMSPLPNEKLYFTDLSKVSPIYSRVIPLEGNTISALLQFSAPFPNISEIGYDETIYTLRSVSHNESYYRVLYKFGDEQTNFELLEIPPVANQKLRAISVISDYFSSSSSSSLKINGKSIPSFPFGYSSFNSFNFSTLFSPLAYAATAKIDYYHTKTTTRNLDSNGHESGSPLAITNVLMRQVDSYSYVLQIQIQGLNNDLFQIEVSDGSIINGRDLVSGTLSNGTFETLVKHNPSTEATKEIVKRYTLKTIEGKLSSYTDSGIYDIVGNTFKYMPIPPIFSINPQDVINISFKPNLIDVSNSDQYVEMFFNISNMDIPRTLQRPRVQIYYNNYYTNDDNIFDGFYDKDIEMFVVPITIRQKLFTGKLKYVLYSYPNSILSNLLSESYGKDVQGLLNITSNYADLMGPLIINIKTIQPSPVFITKPTTIGWEFTVQDLQAGLNYGIAYIKSQQYPVEINQTFSLSSPSFKSGDVFTSTHQILLDLPYPIGNNTYTIDFEIYDNLGNFATSRNTFQDTSLFVNPFINIMNSKIYSKRTIQVNSTYPDNYRAELPVLKGFNINVSPDVSSYPENRDLGVEFNVIYANDRHPLYKPTFSMTAVNMEVISSQANITSISSTVDKYINVWYSAVVRLPFGFGYQGSLFSIYGLVDVFNNYRGCSALDLRSFGFPYLYETSFYINELPVIERAYIDTRTSNLTILGHRLGQIEHSPIVVNIDPGTGVFQPFDALFISGPVVVVNYTSFGTIEDSNNIRVSINKSFTTQSNIVKVDIVRPKPPTSIPVQTPKPTTTPRQCRGGCANNGVCNDGQCICISPYWGPNCNSESVVDIPYQPDTSSPTIVTKGNFTTGISVIQLRELTPEGHVVATYNLTDWSYENITNDITSYESYRYSINVTSRQPTLIVVKVDIFKNETDYQFAGKNFTMAPSTVKYTITVYPYQFDSLLNSLQVIMSASVNADRSDSQCTQTQVGKNENEELQWIKIRVRDNSIYGRFIDSAIVDGRNTKITNTLLNDTDILYNDPQSNNTSVESKSFIAMNIPSFRVLVEMDPDFSMLVEKDNIEGACNSKNSDDKNYRLIGIIVGSVAGGLIVIAILGAILYKKFRYQLRIYMASKKQKNDNIELS